jgi:tRNA(adenine34) deaminase
MCAGALYWSQLSRLVYGASDTHRGYQVMGTKLHPKTEVKTGVMADEASVLMQRFFSERRNKK